MLKKKRLNSDMTELERLENGDIPLPNSGKIETFYNYMNIVSTQLELKLEPLTLWYAICLSLDNDKLLKQFIHCKESIEKDFPTINHSKLL